MAALYGGTLSLMACLNGALPRTEAVVRHFQWWEWIGFWAAGAVMLTGLFWLRFFIPEARPIVVRRAGLLIGKRLFKFERVLGFAVVAEPEAQCAKLVLLLRDGNRAEYGVAHEDEAGLAKALEDCGVSKMSSIGEPPFPVDRTAIVRVFVVCVAVLLAFPAGALLLKSPMQSFARMWTEPYPTNYFSARTELKTQMESAGMSKKMTHANWREFADGLAPNLWPGVKAAMCAAFYGLFALWYAIAFLALAWLENRNGKSRLPKWKEACPDAFGLPLNQSRLPIRKLQIFLVVVLVLFSGLAVLAASERTWESGEIQRATAHLQTMQKRFAAENVALRTEQWADLIRSNSQFTVARGFETGAAILWLVTGIISGATLALQHASNNLQREIEVAVEQHYKLGD